MGLASTPNSLDYLPSSLWGNLRRLLQKIALAGCPSGQWEGTVNPPALPSKVQILHPPPATKRRSEIKSLKLLRLIT
jgi:hypothetical protein